MRKLGVSKSKDRGVHVLRAPRRVKVEGPGAKAVRELREEAWPCDAIRHPGVEEALARSTEGEVNSTGMGRSRRCDSTCRELCSKIYTKTSFRGSELDKQDGATNSALCEFNGSLGASLYG
jgi:hypothetical protein